MALVNFLSKCPIVIDRSLVTSTVTDFPLLINQDNLPTEIFGVSGGMKDTAGDVRFSSDATGVNELPRDIVAVDKSNSELVVRVLMPTVNGVIESEDTTIYVWWNNSSAGEPGRGTDSFSENAYLTNYYGVFDFTTVSLILICSKFVTSV